MKNTKLVQLLATLSLEELRTFEKSFANSNSKAFPLLQKLLKCYPDFDASKVQKAKLFRAAFGAKALDENYLRKATNQIFQALKQFLIDSAVQEDAFLKERLFLEELRKRDLGHLYQLAAQKTAKAIAQSPFQDSQYYLQQYELAQANDAFSTQQQARQYNAALQDQSDFLDLFFLTKKLQLSCKMLNSARIIAGDYDTGLMESLLSILQSNPSYTQHLPIQIYLEIYGTLKPGESEAHFQNLAQLLAQRAHQFQITEAAEMYRYAQNYCIRQVNQGNKRFLRALLDLFKHQLNNGLLMPNGVLAADDFKNIIMVGLQLDEQKWVYEFMQTHKSKLAESDRENVYNYNLGLYYYGTKDYDNAIQLLNTVKFTDAYYEINSKIILLKTYFHQEDYFPFYYLIDSFKLSLKRNKKVATSYRTSITNFLIQ